jgi:hypothetical protein
METAMSAFDPPRHFATANCRIAKGSIDHLVGAGEHCSQDGEAECLGLVTRIV